MNQLRLFSFLLFVAFGAGCNTPKVPQSPPGSSPAQALPAKVGDENQTKTTIEAKPTDYNRNFDDYRSLCEQTLERYPNFNVKEYIIWLNSLPDYELDYIRKTKKLGHFPLIQLLTREYQKEYFRDLLEDPELNIKNETNAKVDNGQDNREKETEATRSVSKSLKHIFIPGVMRLTQPRYRQVQALDIISELSRDLDRYPRVIDYGAARSASGGEKESNQTSKGSSKPITLKPGIPQDNISTPSSGPPSKRDSMETGNLDPGVSIPNIITVNPQPAGEPTLNRTRLMIAANKAHIAELPTGNAVFSTPSKGKIGKAIPIKLIISLDKEVSELKKQFKNQTEVDSAQVKVSHEMSANLAGPDFEISSVNPARQPVTDQIEWNWDVIPKRGGTCKLTLVITVIIPSGDGFSEKTFDTLEREITVEVSSFGQLIAWVIQNGEAIGSLIAIPLTVVGITALFKRKKKQAGREKYQNSRWAALSNALQSLAVRLSQPKAKHKPPARRIAPKPPNSKPPAPKDSEPT